LEQCTKFLWFLFPAPSHETHNTLRSQQHDTNQDDALYDEADSGVCGEQEVEKDDDNRSNDRSSSVPSPPMT